MAAGAIAAAIIRCWKRKQVVCVPIRLTQKKKSGYAHHANMLIFNTYRMEAEHFEPHGEVFKGDSNLKGDRKKVRGINLNDAIK